ncbi:MAG: carotenoid oxygenase family protein [Cyanobacteria bacterium P01_F01_bin.53]
MTTDARLSSAGLDRSSVSQSRTSPFPVGILSASQEEVSGATLDVFEGALPDDLQGHVFFLAAAGNVDSQQKVDSQHTAASPIVYPSADGTPVVNGNGMIYRIDFDQPGQATFHTRLAKTPCYFADEAVQADPRYEEYRFDNFGLARLSPWLGVRSMANTAIVSMKFDGDDAERLLLTTDVGRPYEIDPFSLKLITPVGATREWREQLPLELPFTMVMTTAHPRFDSATQTLFTVNIGKSISTVIASLLQSDSHKLTQAIIRVIEHLARTLESPSPSHWTSTLAEVSSFGRLLSKETASIPGHIRESFQGFQELLHEVIAGKIPGLFDELKQLVDLLIQMIEGLKGVEDFIYLMCWDGKGELARWRVLLEDGSPAKVAQTIHQMAVTKDYVVLMDTGFKVGPEQLVSRPVLKNKKLEKLVRSLLDYRESPDSLLYIIPRSDLTEGSKSVTAKQLTIPGAVLHFLADYENPQGQIILHLAHTYGWDPAEWVRSYDDSPYSTSAKNNTSNGASAVASSSVASSSVPSSSVPAGMMTSPMDQHAFARYVIDGDIGKVNQEASTLIQDDLLSWSIAMFAYESSSESSKFNALYWNSWGCWADLLTEFIVELYDDYPKHFAPGKKALLDVVKQGIPDTLCQLKNGYPDALEIAQQYAFPLGVFATSPQFVPKSRTGDSDTEEVVAESDTAQSTDGYLVCTILNGDTSELWVFDAQNLAKGVICKMRHPKLNFGFTTHTNWLPRIAPRTADYYISAREDYGELVKKQSPVIQKVFEEFVYPQFPDRINSKTFPPVPPSLVTAQRTEVDLPLNILSGALPTDLQGHMFIVNAAGSVDSGGLPYPSGDTIFNGDGMIYRLSFDNAGEVRFTSKLAKTPCYYADEITHRDPQFSQFKFKNLGLSRFSLLLGSRNQINTAFVPMAVPEDGPDRLLVTFDAGRPFEIDTQTLEVITPIGENAEWTPEVGLDYVFPPVLSTAHPGFDSVTQQLFTVNFGRSIPNFLDTIPFFHEFESLADDVDTFLAKVLPFFNQGIFHRLFDWLEPVENSLWETYRKLLLETSGKHYSLGLKDFVYLIGFSWGGSGERTELKRWKLVSPEGKPIAIRQSMHQIGVTRDYIVLLDTDLKVGIEQALNNPFPEDKEIERILRELIARPVSPDSTFYIVRRADLQDDSTDQDAQVVARQLTIPLSAIHFLVDYDNPDGTITLHVAHNCAADIAEWIRQYDTLAGNPKESVPAYLWGMITEEADISRMGRYDINGETGEVLTSKVFYDNELTWGIGLYAYQDRLPDGSVPTKLDQIYWQTSGFWHDLITNFTLDLYKNYPYRVIPVEQLLDSIQSAESRPPCLFRLDTDAMAIADSYQFPLVSQKDDTWSGHLVSSPQFVPRKNGTGSATDGYIVCTVFTPTQSEIWIFDAQNLAAGPLCRLGHSTLSFAYTMHTTWLPKIARRTAAYNVSVRSDYQPIVDRQPKHLRKQVQQLFEQIYPAFETHR